MCAKFLNFVMIRIQEPKIQQRVKICGRKIKSPLKVKKKKIEINTKNINKLILEKYKSKRQKNCVIRFQPKSYQFLKQLNININTKTDSILKLIKFCFEKLDHIQI